MGELKVIDWNLFCKIRLPDFCQLEYWR